MLPTRRCRGPPRDAAGPREHPHPGRRRDLPARHGRRPHIQVLVPYTVLLGVNDPCELAGHGAITADQARTIIADGTLQRLLYDPASGIVLDYGRTRYEPPETLKQFIIARDRTCRTPGCLQPAERCQIDHVEPFRPGKPTGGCTSHHHPRREMPAPPPSQRRRRFLNTRDPDGTTHWTTPLGRNYTLPPPQSPIPSTTTPKTDSHQHSGHTSQMARNSTRISLTRAARPPIPRGATTDASGATTDARGVPDGTVDPEPPPF